MPLVTDFLFDDENEDKIARHGLSAQRVLQVLDQEHILVPNRKSRRASHLLIGTDHGGACIAIPIEPTHDPTLWRPVTAWPCKDNEYARLQRR
jgi:uncharacterized DUF497 family protein